VQEAICGSQLPRYHAFDDQRFDVSTLVISVASYPRLQPRFHVRRRQRRTCR